MIELKKQLVDVKVNYNVKNELLSMKELFSLQSYSKQEQLVTAYLCKKLESIPGVSFSKDALGNLLITKGDLKQGEYYPCLVAHQDTVHAIVKGNYRILHQTIKGGLTKLFATANGIKAGIGGDDQAGIWLILKLLTELPVLKAIFTTQEETGGYGAATIDIDFFTNVGYVIECDRRGNSDVITSIFDDICSYDFKMTIFDTMTKYGFKENDGMFTDIVEFMSNGVELSCINVSVGYYNPHTKDEFVIAEDLLKSTQFVKECISVLGLSCYSFKSVPTNRYAYNSTSKYTGMYSDFDWGYDEREFYSKPSVKSFCTCTETLIDLSCDIHNPMLHKYSSEVCTCGEVMQERDLTYYCPFCDKHFTNL